jgi:hypothetical protein
MFRNPRKIAITRAYNIKLSSFPKAHRISGKITNPTPTARPEFLVNKNIINITINTILNSSGVSASRTPRVVATPLPPLNLRKRDQLCPDITANPTGNIHSIDSPSHLAIKIARLPFAISNRRTVIPENGPISRAVFIVPTLPVPNRLISTFFFR